MYYHAGNREKVDQYLSKASTKRLMEFGRTGELYDAFIAYMKDRLSSSSSGKSYTLFRTLLAEGHVHIDDVLAERPAHRFLKMLLPEQRANQLKQIWHRCVDYPYTSGLSRRPFRTKKSTSLLLDPAIELLVEMVTLQANNVEFRDFLSDPKESFGCSRLIAHLTALDLDTGNDELLNQVGSIIYGDAVNGTVSSELICGMLMSHDVRAHKMIGDLLIAAKLQEGLRQAIVEHIDDGCKDAYVFILRLILENDLLRFSSVVRALDVWTGLTIFAEKPTVIRKSLEAMLCCLTDRSKIEEFTNGSDNLLIHIGLWAVAFDEVNDIVPIIHDLLSSNVRHKKLGALYFLRQTQLPLFQLNTAKLMLCDKDDEVLAWAVDNLFAGQSPYPYMFRDVNVRGASDSQVDTLFAALKPLAERLPKNEIVFSPSVFPSITISLSSLIVLEKMVLTISGGAENSQIDFLANMMEKMRSDTRCCFVEYFLAQPETPIQKHAIVQAMGDRSADVRKAASDIALGLHLSNEDYKAIENMLGYKSGDLRKNAITVLLRMPTDELLSALDRLLHSGETNRRLAAIDIAQAMDGHETHKKGYDKAIALVASTTEFSQKERIHAEKLAGSQKEKFSAANGFGLYDLEKQYKPTDDIPLVMPKDILNSDLWQAKNILKTLSDAVAQNQDYEYDAMTWVGTKESAVLGSLDWLLPIYGTQTQSQELRFNNLPLQEVWKSILENYTPEQLIATQFFLMSDHDRIYDSEQWYDELMKNLFSFIPFKALREFADAIPYQHLSKQILNVYLQTLESSSKFSMANNICRAIIARAPANRLAEPYVKLNRDNIYYRSYRYYLSDSPKVEFWLDLLRESAQENDCFVSYFNTAYRFYASSQYESCPLQAADFGRAFSLGVICRDEVLAQLMGRPISPDFIAETTSNRWHSRNKVAEWPEFLKCVDEAVEFIVRTEVQRGELTTQVSRLAARVEKCYGAANFVTILLNAEKDTYVRGYDFVGDDSTKRNMLSHLLKCLYPLPHDNEQTLKNLLEGKNVSERQLIDGAMYSPQWIDIIENYLKWEGLRSACWYFHAHVSDSFSPEKAAIVARFSPIDPQDFKDGAFDPDWFRDAYETLGAERFQIVYNSAKYIAGGGLHRRSQLFADAVCGKLTVQDVEKQVQDSRNKDKLLSYSLIPHTGMQDLLHRYRFIQRFAKEAKQFGSQRQASESRVATIAFENLARNAGYSDVNRLMWSMETESISEVLPFFEPVPIVDITVSIHVDEKGTPSLFVTRDSVQLKDIPARLKNNEAILATKAVLKQLKEQHQRARISLESSMINGDAFIADELLSLERNPVLSSMLHAMVFQCNDQFGFFSRGSLVSADGNVIPLVGGDILTIAHPFALYKAGVWAQYQACLYSKKIVQPIRQIFRELYLPNADELFEGTISRRYSGHQVQPKKTLALLKTRGWTASYEDGLQKTYYRQDIVVEVLAMADWFSPSEIEYPTLEVVQFIDRKTGEALQFANISPTIFSEAMRDVDLVVSVAHAGGVDPEASLSTVEMRIAILNNLLPLMNLSNVRLQSSHALITGHFGEYTVHLGSGVVHMMAKGSVNILPVHSQHRGRIFLPFVDDDPKTAEIVSKIALLAEDKKIKDPFILEQIR